MTIHDARARFPELVHGGLVLFRGMAAASRPTEDLTISEFSDAYRKVSPESGSPWPGDFLTDRVPYLREPQDCLHPDHPARRVTCRWAAQLGKSTAIENWFCFIVDQAPGSMMIVLPTLEEATKFNRIKLQPTIEVSPRIAHKVMPVNSRDEQGSTSAFKRYAGGFCQIVNAGSSKGLQMVSIKYLAMDEVTGYPKDVDGRGSPRDQARARQKMYGDLAKEWQGSTPGIAGECAITEDFEAGDQRYRYMPCPHCGTYQALEFDMMRGPDAARGLPVHMRCVRCDEPILDGHKRQMEEQAHWIARRVHEGDDPVPLAIAPADLAKWLCPVKEGRCHEWEPSYHLWAAYAPRERWAEIWKRWEDAQGDTTKMKAFYQQDLALPYDPGGVEIDHEKIVEAARDEGIPNNVIPEWAALLVSAADVQGYGIKWGVYAIGPRGQYCLIDREIFEGSPDKSDEPWIKLSDALSRTYVTPSGREKGLDISGVDTGWATDRVYRFCAGRPNVLALDGREPIGLPWLGTPKKKDIKDHRNRVIAKVLLYPVGLYDVKTAVAAALANLVQGVGEDSQWPRGTIHFAANLCDTDFAKELTAERLVDEEEEARTSLKRGSRKLVNPKAGRKWKKINGRQNDWFDVTVYAYALGWHLENKRRLTTDRWADLIRDLHGETEQINDLFDLADESPFSKQKPKPAPATDKKSRQRKRWGSYS